MLHRPARGRVSLYLPRISASRIRSASRDKVQLSSFSLTELSIISIVNYLFIMLCGLALYVHKPNNFRLRLLGLITFELAGSASIICTVGAGAFDRMTMVFVAKTSIVIVFILLLMIAIRGGRA